MFAFVDIGGRASPQVGAAGAVGSEPASLSKFADLGDHRQPAGQGKASDPLAQADGKTLGKGEQRIREILPDCRERHLKLVARARLDGAQGEPDRARRFLRVLPLGDFRRVVRIPQHGHALRARDGLLKQFQPLARHIRSKRTHSRDVAPRTCQALNEAAADRIGGERHHDRDRVACPHGGEDRRVAASHEHVDREARQLARQIAEAFELAVGAAILHLEMTPFHIAEVAQSKEKLPSQVGCDRLGRSLRFEIAKADDLRLLRVRRERPRNGAAQYCDELAPPHRLPQPEDRTLPHRCRECRVVHHSKVGCRWQRWVLAVLKRFPIRGRN
jgi:hypothetical protein